MVFSLMVKHLFSLKPGTEMQKMRHDFHIMRKGFFSLPFKVPGTSFHKSMQVIINIFPNKFESNNEYTAFVFDYILMISVNVFILLFRGAGHDTRPMFT